MEKNTKPHNAYMCETMERLKEINKLARRNLKAAQLRQKRNYDARIRTVQKFKVGDHVLVFCRAVPAGGTLKLLALWRGPYRVTEVHQGGRWYVLSNGHKAHFENLIPYRSSPDQWAVTYGSDGMHNIIVDTDRDQPNESK